MLTFPTYRNELPKCLRVFTPSHYVLLAYWIYFRPTALKYYLYQALPDLYDTEHPLKFFRKWRSSAFRNLFIMLPIICMCLSVLLSVPVTLFSAWRLHVPINWSQWFDSGMLGIAVGLTIGMAFGMVGRVLGGVALSSIFGVVYGVTIGVVGGVSLSVAFGVSFPSLMDGAIIVGAVFGIASGTALTTDIEIGIALSLAFGVMAAISFGAEFIIFKILGKSFGALLVRGAMSIAFVLGAFRLLFYPVQVILALGSLFHKAIHPIEWDELTILPLPFTRWMMLSKLRQDEHQGLQFLTDAGRNIFRRAALKSVIYRYLHKHPNPLRVLYDLLANPGMEEYFLIPVTSQHWEQHVSARHVFLGELALRPVEATQHPRFRRSARWLNIRPRRETPLTRFAGMLYDLSDERKIEKEGIELIAYHEVYSNLSGYPNAEEIALSYEAMAAFLLYPTLSDLPKAAKITSNPALKILAHDALRPAVLQTITRLGQIGKDIEGYCHAANRQTQLTVLARVTGKLNDLKTSVTNEVMAPEQNILQHIISQWQQLLISAIGDVGKSELINEAQTAFEFHQ